jgi:hypothetical protein
MSRRDDLIREAFEDGALANRDWTREERRELELLREAREGLQALRDVPAPQLSVERLRDAVLKAEMRQRATGFRWKLVTAPAGLALAVVAFLALRPEPEPSPMVAAVAESAPVAQPAPPPDALPSAPEIVAQAEPPAQPGPQAAARPSPEPRAGVRAGRAVRVARAVAQPPAATRVEAPEPAVRGAPPGGATEEAAVTVAGAGPEPAVGGASVPPESEVTVVLIQYRPDAATGSRPASEVLATNDVVIGG